MQSVSAGFTSACQATVRQPVMRLDVSWDGITWTDESSNLLSYTYDLDLGMTGGELVPAGRVNSAMALLANVDQRYSPLASGGDTSIRSYLTGAAGLVGKEVRLYQGFYVSGSAEYVRVFTGVIYRWAEDDRAGTVRLDMRDVGHKLLQVRASTPMVQLTNASEWIEYLANVYFGLTSSDLILDQATATIPWAWLDDDSVLEEIWATAASTGGWAYFDQLGRLHFERPTHWLSSPHDASVWTFGGGDIENLTPVPLTDAFATSIVVRYAPRVPGQSAVLYELETPRTIRPGETVQFDARLQSPAVAVYELVEDDYDLRTAAGVQIAQYCDISIVPLAQRVTVTVRNNHVSLSAVLGYLQVRGMPLLGGPSQQVEDTAEVPPLSYMRTRTVGDNVYLQTALQANRLVGYLLDRFSTAQRLFPLRNVAGVPQLELGDRVTIGDGGRLLGSSRDGYVVAVRGRGNSSGFVQDIDVLDAESLWPSGTYFVIGSTALGSGEAWY